MSSLLNNGQKRAGGPQSAEGKARALANLQSWQSGQSGNPAGRPKNVGLSQLEQMNELSARNLTTDELRAIAGDPSSPHNLAVAAERLIAQRNPDEPLAREAVKLVLDYTNGKPRQHLDVTQESFKVEVAFDVEQLSGNLQSELLRLLGSCDSPALVESSEPGDSD